MKRLNHSFVMQMFCASSVLLAAGWLLCGCETPGEALAKSAADQIRDGQTTQAEIEKIFGEPFQTTKSPQGKTLYVYQRFYEPDMVPRSGVLPPRRDESNLLLLSVLFNSCGIVEKHLHSHTQPNIDRIRRNSGQKLGADELARIQPQKTTRAELTSWFGPHVAEVLNLAGYRQVTWEYVDAFNIGGRVEVQALEVLLDDNDKVLSHRITKRDPWRN